MSSFCNFAIVDFDFESFVFGQFVVQKSIFLATFVRFSCFCFYFFVFLFFGFTEGAASGSADGHNPIIH